jgi:HK97 family phage prohead protease
MPQPIKVSLDELIASRKDISDDNGVLYKAHVAPRSWNDEERSAVFVMSAETEDSYGDVVVQSGIDTATRFDKNPVALFGHRSWDMPVGSWSDLKMVRSSPKRTEGKIIFTPEGVDEVADRVAKNVQAGVLRAASIGFTPKRYERILDDEGEWRSPWGFKFHEIELHECSVVTIPAVREALIKGAGAKAEDIVSPEVIEEFLEHLKANPALAKMIKRDLYEGVYREITGNKTASIMLESKIGVEKADLDRMEAIAKRIEAAAAKMAPAGDGDAADAPADEVDEVAKDLEGSIETVLKDFAPKVEEIAEVERKSALTKLLDGVRAIFKAPEPPQPEPPAPADPEIQKALRQQADEIAARYAA